MTFLTCLFYFVIAFGAINGDPISRHNEDPSVLPNPSKNSRTLAVGTPQLLSRLLEMAGKFPSKASSPLVEQNNSHGATENQSLPFLQTYLKSSFFRGQLLRFLTNPANSSTTSKTDFVERRSRQVNPKLKFKKKIIFIFSENFEKKKIQRFLRKRRQVGSGQWSDRF
jgi:hypothetical protein